MRQERVVTPHGYGYGFGVPAHDGGSQVPFPVADLSRFECEAETGVAFPGKALGHSAIALPDGSQAPVVRLTAAK